MPSQSSTQGVWHSQDTVLVAAGWITQALGTAAGPKATAVSFFFLLQKLYSARYKMGCSCYCGSSPWSECCCSSPSSSSALCFSNFAMSSEKQNRQDETLGQGLSHIKARCSGPVNTHLHKKQGSYACPHTGSARSYHHLLSPGHQMLQSENPPVHY